MTTTIFFCLSKKIKDLFWEQTDSETHRHKYILPLFLNVICIDEIICRCRDNVGNLRFTVKIREVLTNEGGVTGIHNNR